jgi:hypothetical protein
MTLPVPDNTQAYTDKDGKPTKEFFNYLKALTKEAASQGGGPVASLPWQVVAAGYTTNTLAIPKFDATAVDIGGTGGPGYSLYLYNWFGSSVNTSTIVFNDDGSMTLNGDNTGPNGQLSTAFFLGSGNFRGKAFGGGGYFECVFKFNPWDVINNHFHGSPAWWSMSVEHMAGMASDHWPGQVPGYMHFAEVDFFEYFADGYVPGSGTNYWTNAIHDWRDTGPGDFLPNYPWWVVAILNYVEFGQPGSDPDLSKYHKYACLWVPPTSTQLGYLQFFFDNMPVKQIWAWRKYDNTASVPAVKWAYTYNHDYDQGGFANQNVRVVIQPSLLSTTATNGNIYLLVALASGTGKLDGCYIGYFSSVSGTGGLPGANLISPSVFAGVVGAGNIPTGWTQTGTVNASSLITPAGGTVNGVTTLADQIVSLAGGGFQGIQVNTPPSLLAGRRYAVSAWVAKVSGVTACDVVAYFGSNQVRIIDAATVNAATVGIYNLFTVDYVASGSESLFAIINAAAATGTGFAFALPGVQLYSIDPFVVSFDGNQVPVTFNGGSRRIRFTPNDATVIYSDPIPFVYDHTRPIMVAMHFSGSNIALGADAGIAATTYFDTGNDNSGVTTVPLINRYANTNCGIFQILAQQYTEMSILDVQHLVCHVGTTPGMPMTIRSINVWQKDTSGNLDQ